MRSSKSVEGSYVCSSCISTIGLDVLQAQRYSVRQLTSCSIVSTRCNGDIDIIGYGGDTGREGAASLGCFTQIGFNKSIDGVDSCFGYFYFDLYRDFSSNRKNS